MLIAIRATAFTYTHLGGTWYLEKYMENVDGPGGRLYPPRTLASFEDTYIFQGHWCPSRTSTSRQTPCVPAKACILLPFLLDCLSEGVMSCRVLPLQPITLGPPLLA